MTIKDLKEYISDLPDDYTVELGSFLNMKEDYEDLEEYDVIFDLPIIGIAKSDNDKHCRFILKGDKQSFKDFGATIIDFDTTIN